jgi:DNA-binding MurR/RpiR family transcriptional regulator
MARSKHLAPSKAGCLIRIKSAMESFKPSERMIAEFVLENPERVVQMSIAELARDVEVGESTVMRFCRAIDYKGYQEFKLRLAQDLVEPVEYIHEKIKFSDDIAQLAQKTFQTNLSAVENTQKSLDPEMVEIAAKSLTDARRIDLYGAGYSFFSALDAKLKFTRLGLLSDAYGDAHLQAMAAATLQPQDVAIGISHSGSTIDVVDALSLAHRSGATTVAITNFSPSPITKAADIVLLTSSAGTPLGGEVLTTRIAQLCVIDVLSVAVAIALGEDCLNAIRKTSEAVKKKRY